jgi:curved DNA-binding protein CbpA
LINYYTLLGIGRDSSKTAITAAAKARIKEQKAMFGADGNELATQTIAQIDDALLALSNPNSRAQYDAELTAEIEAQAKADADKIDYSAYLLESSDDWESLCSDAYGDPVQSIRELVDLIIDLPNPEISKPILLSFLLTPSAISTTLPVAFCYGASGSGKSQVPKLASKIWGVTMLLNNSTYAGIRNQIQKDRWHDPVMSREEKNYILAWDDIDRERLMGDGGLYPLLKGGYSRSSSTITMAGKDGENITFNVFGGRVLSSITPFFSDPKMSELKRRMLVFHMVKSSKAITDFDEISWGGIQRLAIEIWQSQDNLNKFVAAKKAIRAQFKKGFSELTVDRSNLFTDVLSTGVALGFFESIHSAIKTIEIHERQMEELATNEQDMFAQLLQLFVQQEEHEAAKTASKVRIRPDRLKDFIGSKVRSGEMDGFPRRGELPAQMRKFGYALDPDLGAWISTLESK